MDDLIKRLQRADEYEPLGHDGWEAATALSEAQATIARQQVMLDRALESNGDMQMTIARLREAIQAILDDVGYNVEDLGGHAKEKLIAAL